MSSWVFAVRAFGPFALALVYPAAGVLAQAPGDAPVDRDSSAQTSAEAGMFLPETIAPRTDSQRAYGVAFGGYDTAKRSAQSEALRDVSITSWLAARAGVIYAQTGEPSRLRPALGMRALALRQERAGFDLGIGAYYKPEGFTEAEGEIELVLALARRFDRLTAFANVVYGQDPEAAERDGELRLAALYAVSNAVQAGFDARLRVDLGSEEGKLRAEGGAEFDLIMGPTASLAMGPVAAIAQAGLSLNGTQPAKAGALALLGIAGAL